VPEEQLVQVFKSANVGYVSKRPGPVHHSLSFGGPDAVRSITKSCLELWASAVGNDEVRSSPYQHARSFVLAYADSFNSTSVHLDSRLLPGVDQLKQRFGNLFNLSDCQNPTPAIKIARAGVDFAVFCRGSGVGRQ